MSTQINKLPQHFIEFKTFFGEVFIIVEAGFLIGILWDKQSLKKSFPLAIKKEVMLHKEVKRQLSLYFENKLTSFDLPIKFSGTEFQKSVWKQLLKIPYAQTYSYSDIANGVDSPKAVRAVGAANGKNKISIVVPCHRVIGKNGKLTGFAGGLSIKQTLLDLEQTTI